MATTNYLKKNKDSIIKLLPLLAAFVLMGLVIPAIGYEDALTSPSWWVSVVDFFASVRDHVSSYWMFYTIAGAILYFVLNGNLKMSKMKSIKKNESSISKVLVLVVVFVLSGLIIPAIGTTATSPAYWVSTVDFFTSVRDHVTGYWMFYTLGGAILFAYLKNSKK